MKKSLDIIYSILTIVITLSSAIGITYQFVGMNILIILFIYFIGIVYGAILYFFISQENVY